MDKKLIGVKVDWNMGTVVSIFLAGVALIIGGFSFFIFVIGGAIGGAVAGGTIAMGVMLCIMSVGSRNLPNELVYINEESVYLNKETIALDQIKSVKSAGISIVITPLQGRAIRQGFLKNSTECAMQIQAAMKKESVQ